MGSGFSYFGGSSSSIINSSLHQEDPIMWIVVRDGISEEIREDTFWEGMVNNIHNSLLSPAVNVPMAVVLSGHSMTEEIGAHTCAQQAAVSSETSSVNAVSIDIRHPDQRRAEEAALAASIVIRDMLDPGKTYIKVKYDALVYSTSRTTEECAM
ncbi:PREDICTED: uncharacterized protein LOC109581201 [Amphimedon queenslandica]|uniref:Uncharacterized protein n=1 Tax=Amphimedon queenslandica TaxID=400682 RepID=A0A1X7VUU4_AMPQE|nr:PREDICTED: uncharacterized protein LOC109581201 [Amphimedon queenslandica]|eukprot:XP_019850642.1 PREDICTED: uncharacterized protein LOC109581201 [Amphimedon queenslandica]